jgi:hypothetical protein
MRIDLQSLATKQARLELPRVGDVQPFIAFDSASGVRGVIQMDAAKQEVQGGFAERVLVSASLLRIADLHLAHTGPAAFDRGAAEVRMHGGQLHLDLTVEHLKIEQGTVALGSVDMEGTVMMRGFVLRQHGAEGELYADYAEFTHCRLNIGPLGFKTPHYVAHGLRLRWSDVAGFSLETRSARAGDLEITIAEHRTRTTGMQLEGMRFRNGQFELDSVVSRTSFLRTSFSPEAAGVPAPRSSRPPPAPAPRGSTPPPRRSSVPPPPEGPILIDWALLDAVTGKVRADACVDMNLAVMARRAEHQFRFNIERGVVNYRKLERGLSRLEDALVGFSARNDKLVFELGLPFMPAMAPAIPLVRWNLSEDDQDLAAREEVRLRVLAAPELRTRLLSEDDAEVDRNGLLRLQRIDVTHLEVSFDLPEVTSAVGARIGKLGITGMHARGEASYLHDGGEIFVQLDAHARTFVTAVSGLPLGEHTLSVGELRAHALDRVNFSMSSRRTCELACDLSGLEIRNVRFSPQPGAVASARL